MNLFRDNMLPNEHINVADNSIGCVNFLMHSFSYSELNPKFSKPEDVKQNYPTINQLQNTSIILADLHKPICSLVA